MYALIIIISVIIAIIAKPPSWHLDERLENARTVLL